MIDYELMPAGRELDRAICEHLGWTVTKITWTPASPVDSGWMFVLVTPDGRKSSFGHQDQDKVWFVVDAKGCPGDVALLPYSTDANLALSLPLDPLLFFDLHGSPTRDDNLLDAAGSWNAWIDHRFEALHNGRHVGRADTPALAICRAWLDWKEKAGADEAGVNYELPQIEPTPTDEPARDEAQSALFQHYLAEHTKGDPDKTLTVEPLFRNNLLEASRRRIEDDLL